MATKIEWCQETNTRVKRSDGYVLVYAPSYPAAKPNGYVYEHRLVMANHLGRVLHCGEVVHHVNGDRSDNSIKNLRLMENGKHVSTHSKSASPSLIKKRTENLLRYTKERTIKRVVVDCACGCGMKLETPDKKGRQRKYIHGHNNRGRSWKWEKHA